MTRVREVYLAVSSLVWLLVFTGSAATQEGVTIAYGSADASNFVWYAAVDTGFYNKTGLEVELIFIPSSTTAFSSVVAGDIQLANNSGGAVANGAVGGASLIMTACYINILAYELVVDESIKSAEALKGKSIGISRVGSASDVAARALVKGPGLEPVREVPILQVGGAPE